MDYVLELPDVIRKGTYSGETMNGIPNGFGVFETTNSSGINWHYIGQWENGEIKGDGGMYWDNGREEIGIFKENNLLCGTICDGTGNYAWITMSQTNTAIMKRKNTVMMEVYVANAASTRIADCTIKEQFTPKTGKCFSPANLEKDSIGI